MWDPAKPSDQRLPAGAPSRYTASALDCPPLVRTFGWPNSTAIHLLRMLADNGAALSYHDDFDGEGCPCRTSSVQVGGGGRPSRSTLTPRRFLRCSRSARQRDRPCCCDWPTWA
ncbi:DUF2399 domain-containing protein [Streptomyces sp. NPDC052043]|uniref:DUF2399 domain-containing protein n=1 Tax=Streptomyces sp. NPDC052043 TaxID=3365684 RepID=UPI0037D8E167